MKHFVVVAATVCALALALAFLVGPKLWPVTSEPPAAIALSDSGPPSKCSPNGTYLADDGTLHPKVLCKSVTHIELSDYLSPQAGTPSASEPLPALPTPTTIVSGPIVVIAVDADPDAPGIQSTRTVALGTGFHVRVVLEPPGANYVGYQAKIAYDDSILDGDGVPSLWTNAPTAATGGNTAAFVNALDCVPSIGTDALQDNDVFTDHVEDDAGVNTILMACVDSAVEATSVPQDLVDFYFTCTTAGTAVVGLADANDGQGGTFVIESAIIRSLASVLIPAAVTCGEPVP